MPHATSHHRQNGVSSLQTTPKSWSVLIVIEQGAEMIFADSATSLPGYSLDRLSLQKRLEEIGELGAPPKELEAKTAWRSHVDF